MNHAIFFFFYNLANHSPFLDRVIVFLAVDFIYIVIVLAGLFLLFHHKVLPSQNPVKEFISKWREFIFLGASGSLAWILAKILKILIHTERPFDIFGNVQPLFLEIGYVYAFPSGHTAVASAIALTLFFTHKKAGYIFMFFAILVGLARVVAGVHFPVDIFGGFILGALIAYLLKMYTIPLIRHVET